ncbi:phosphate acyltransferase PlsX [Gallaecimonas kandeliae]|nr:phosphate acyltransferase PlsX [Gallaecimonas kandeliae]WKE67393.1 phosphate acyltransferase PlsX [Gallaecimonas kandeliae]
MGGDLGPAVTVPAIARALSLHPSLSIRAFACGDISRELHLYGLDKHPRFSLHLAQCSVSMDERPSSALRSKRDSSMAEAIKDVAEGRSQACVSAGNTGALMALSRHFLKTLPGIDRPAIISAMPAMNGKKVYMLDLGANVACDSETLYQFAVMGSAMAHTVEGLAEPRVALLNIGEEEVKGNDQVRHAASLLQDNPHLHYVGYLEGHDIFTNKADVIVCDGFVGNVTLKTCEGIAQYFLAELKASFGNSFWGRLLGRLVRPFIKAIYARVNPDQYNGASLVGLRGIVVKSHGNAGVDAFFNAIGQALHSAERKLPDGIEDAIGTVLLDKH